PASTGEAWVRSVTDFSAAAFWCAFPIAAVTYGDFHISGPGLNTHDGVYQTPALKWQFHRGASTVDYAAMTPASIYDAFHETELEDVQND
ncbi:MAG: hypothetical protein HGB05_22350, partial [Chloroflexi bacterium]|nr:hypothetical protein [Chloroflexota bacterium]